LDGDVSDAAATAMRILVRIGDILGAKRFVEVSSAHIDGCLYHGDGGVEFAELLVAGGGRVAVPTTLNVGALDLLHPELIREEPHRASMARRQMEAYQSMGCKPTWTCAPYQAGHRPGVGEQVAWGESNAVAFVNSVLGARTNRYGDYLDACCALTGRAPLTGLHLEENRFATIVVDAEGLSDSLKSNDAFYPVFGTWLGRVVESDVAAIVGLPATTTEDQLKAVSAAAASTGAVGLFHVVGVTPDAPDLETALGGKDPKRIIRLQISDILNTREGLSTCSASEIDAVAVGSPHFSVSEFDELDRLIAGKKLSIPFYVCTGRGIAEQLEQRRLLSKLRDSGVTIVVDTCVVVTPILPGSNGVLMTNSGKFAHDAPSNTGYEVVYGTLEDCVLSALTGKLQRDESIWR